MPAKEKYTDPALRDKVKNEVHQSDKGGAPGQWSARKAQFMASEYRKRGGSYNTDKSTGQDESQKNLSKWMEEEWQTADGSGKAKHEDGETRSRYLPKKAWEDMNEGEKQKTEEKKVKGSKGGKQFVGNTGGAKGARKRATKEAGKKVGKSQNGEKADGENENGDAQDGEGEYEDEDEDAEDDKEKEDSAPKGRGASRGAKNAVKEKVRANMIELHDQDDSEDAEADGAEGDGPADDEDFEGDDVAADDGGEFEVDEDDEAALDEGDTAEGLINGDGEVDDDAEMEAEDQEEAADEEKAADDDQETNKKQEKADEEAKHPSGSGKKRGRQDGAPADQVKQGSSASKKQKSNDGKAKSQQKSQKKDDDKNGTIGSKHDPSRPPAPVGSSTRLPEVGQTVTWKALPGFVKGKVVEVVREEKEVRGKKVKGSKNDPRVVLEAESGKIAGHKPDTCFFE